MSNLVALLKSRVSANQYDTTRPLSDAEITDLVSLATLAPSAFNLQNWKFIAVRSSESKARLLPLAYGQQKVQDAAVTFIVCGTLSPQDTISASLKPSLDAGILSEQIFNGWVGMVRGMYGENPGFQRDEAVRSASLAAMTLMLAAQDKGMVSGPMIGFDAAGVAAAFGLAATEVPVMLVTVGYPAAGNWPQKPRKPASEVLSIV
jgi:nitroreductase